LSAGLTSRFRLALQREDVPAPILEALHTLQDIVASGIDYVETTHPAHGEAMTQLLAGLQMVGLLDAEEAAQLLALGGGYRYDHDLTEAHVDAFRAEAALTAQIEAGRQRVEQAMNACRSALEAGDPKVPVPAWSDLAAAFAGE
jgi:hypothetical protein